MVRWMLGTVILLGFLVQAQGVVVLWRHKSSKDFALKQIVEERPDFVLTSVWYFPQEAGRIYSRIPILWARREQEVAEIILHTERMIPRPETFLTVLPAQSDDVEEIEIPHWKGKRFGHFGGLPIMRFVRVD
jgi:hypothetical protein